MEKEIVRKENNKLSIVMNLATGTLLDFLSLEVKVELCPPLSQQESFQC